MMPYKMVAMLADGEAASSPSIFSISF